MQQSQLINILCRDSNGERLQDYNIIHVIRQQTSVLLSQVLCTVVVC